jgi:3-oxoadipate enol-lactonase
MIFAELDGVRIRYELTGDPALPVLVMSHSLGADLTMWEPQLAALAPYVRVLRYDTRGHGGSSVPEGPYTATDLGRDVLALLDALGIEQASFCGLSMGGVVGQWLGIHAQDRIQRLVLADTAAKIGTEEGWNSRIETVLRDGLNPIIPGTLERWFTAPFRAAQPETIAHTAAVLGATSAKGYAACGAAICDADFRSGITQIKVPTLIIAGREDPVTSTQDGAFLADAIADSRYVELAAAHLSNVEAADAFNESLLTFLSA